MMASLGVPTATSVRAVPAKLLIDNRIVINNHLQRGRGGKISFTHLIGYAVVQAVRALPEMNAAYAEEDGKPVIAAPHHVNLGLAIDLKAKDGSRQLLVPNIKSAEEMDFRQFWTAYEDMIRRARGGKLTVADFQGTTISLTNPGTIGTEHSVPRLMPGQGAIVGVGAMEYPAAYQGASDETMARLAISKTVTLTSTYDHRIIQGAQSGDFLRIVHQLLLGGDGFYDGIFESLRIPYEPVRWVKDFPYGHEDDVARSARVQELIHAYRVRGHLMADTNPIETVQRKHEDLDIIQHGLTLWDLEREFATGGFGGKPDPCSIPINLYIIATMNPLDRGVDEVDAAFERRFAKWDMPPSADALEVILAGNGLDENTRRRLVQWFRRINNRAPTNPAAAVGHAYFSDVVDTQSLQDVWDYQLKYLVHRAFQYDPDSRTEIIRAWDAIFTAVTPESAPDASAADEDAPAAER